VTPQKSHPTVKDWHTFGRDIGGDRRWIWLCSFVVGSRSYWVRCCACVLVVVASSSGGAIVVLGPSVLTSTERRVSLAAVTMMTQHRSSSRRGLAVRSNSSTSPMMMITTKLMCLMVVLALTSSISSAQDPNATEAPLATETPVAIETPGGGGDATLAPESLWGGCVDPKNPNKAVTIGDPTTICITLADGADWDTKRSYMRLNFRPKADEYSRFHVPKCEFRSLSF
jgi:hypothetical protein